MSQPHRSFRPLKISSRKQRTWASCLPAIPLWWMIRQGCGTLSSSVIFVGRGYPNGYFVAKRDPVCLSGDFSGPAFVPRQVWVSYIQAMHPPSQVIQLSWLSLSQALIGCVMLCPFNFSLRLWVRLFSQRSGPVELPTRVRFLRPSASFQRTPSKRRSSSSRREMHSE